MKHRVISQASRFDTSLRQSVRNTCHFDQTYDWSCGLSAAQSALRFLGRDLPPSDKLIEILRSYGLSDALEDEGLSTPHLAFLLRRLSFASINIALRPDSLAELGGQLLRSPLRFTQRIKPRRQVNPFWSKGMNRALSLLLADGVRIRIGYFGLKDMSTTKPIVVSVSCAEYYEINVPLYLETHFLTLVPTIAGWLVCDGYELKGYEEMENWHHHLNSAARYDWTRWRGDAIVFS